MPIFFFSSEGRSKSDRYLFKNLKYFLFSLSFQWYFCWFVLLSFWGWCHQLTKRTKQDMTYPAYSLLSSLSPPPRLRTTRTSPIACTTLRIIFYKKLASPSRKCIHNRILTLLLSSAHFHSLSIKSLSRLSEFSRRVENAFLCFLIVILNKKMSMFKSGFKIDDLGLE
jgi:hypothetical protein